MELVLGAGAGAVVGAAVVLMIRRRSHRLWWRITVAYRSEDRYDEPEGGR